METKVVISNHAAHAGAHLAVAQPVRFIHPKCLFANI